MIDHYRSWGVLAFWGTVGLNAAAGAQDIPAEQSNVLSEIVVTA